MKTVFLLGAGIFNINLVVSVGHDYEGTREKLKTWFPEAYVAIRDDKELINESKWLTVKRVSKGYSFYYIFVKKFDFSDDHMACLAHEILHVCQFFLPTILKRDSEHEAEAYLHTYWMKGILKELRKNIKHGKTSKSKG